MTCGGCHQAGTYGTVWFNHKTRRWVHGVGDCAKPEPKPVGVSAHA